MNQWRAIIEVVGQMRVRLEAESEADAEEKIRAALADEIHDDVTMRIASMEKLED